MSFTSPSMQIYRRRKIKVILVCLALTVAACLAYYFRYVYTVFVVVADEDIAKWLVSLTANIENVRNVCPVPINDDGSVSRPVVDADITSVSSTPSFRTGSGGEWSPSHCSARFLVALVVPYRDRADHLAELVRQIRPFLQRQNVHYKIYVIEQADAKPFNRGKLLNVGFVEASKEKRYPCFIFQDVDLVPENAKNIYACTKFPRHMSASIDKFDYSVPYDRNFGGVTSILSHQFRSVNGFSNQFYGWGGEDDNFFDRVIGNGLPVIRFSGDVSRYRSLAHQPATASKDRFDKLEEARTLQSADGLNSLSYVLVKKVVTSDYVKVVVQL